MDRCPKCTKTLLDSDLDTGTCPHCQAAFTPVPSFADDGSPDQTMDFGPPISEDLLDESSAEVESSTNRETETTDVRATNETIDVVPSGINAGDETADAVGPEQTIEFAPPTAPSVQDATPKDEPRTNRETETADVQGVGETIELPPAEKFDDAETYDADLTPPPALTSDAETTELDPLATADLGDGTHANAGNVTADSPASIGSTKELVGDDHTVDFSLKSEDETQARVDATWGQTVDQPGVNHTTSLKAPSQTQSHVQSSLVIQNKSMREASKKQRDPADYDLLNLLGQGGMGMVYAARQASIDRTVAIKMLKPNIAAEEDYRNKFLSEACVTGELEHPNIVPIYDLGRNDEGAFFYAMKRVQGTPWEDVLAKKSLEENIEILMKVCDAVAFSHSKGIVHRDLKPENVMLGGYGEVLVMDWGMAIPTTPSRTFGGIPQSFNMGGTPAYMSPEMVMGPMEKIGPASDVYLLSGMLYEIVTGLRPHKGKSARDCLYSASRNVIQETDKQSPLIDIAVRGLAFEPQDRYADVVALQDAIREYQSHSESIVLSTRAASHLETAKQTNDYDDFNRSVFGFQQAVEMWDENTAAQQGLVDAKLLYARSASAKGDYDLGAGLLDTAIPEHAAVHREITTLQRERDARAQRLTTYKRVGLAMAAMFFVTVSALGLYANWQRGVAVTQRGIAETERDNAREAEKAERLAKEKEVDATKEQERLKEEAIGLAESEAAAKKKAEDAAAAEKIAADKARQEELKAKAAKLAAERARDDAMIAEGKERDAKVAAVAAQKQAVAAQLEEEKQRKAAVAAKQREAYEAYVARIGAAAAKIEENAFDTARQMLDECKPQSGEVDHRGWEWQRLSYLCQQATAKFDCQSALESIATVNDSRGQFSKFAVVGDSGTIEIHNVAGGNPAAIKTTASQIHAVTFSPNAKTIAIGTGDETGYWQLYDVATGKRRVLNVEEADRHRGDVLSVEFSADGRRLLTSSKDETARVWDVATGRLLAKLHGHHWWVWQARFVPVDNAGQPQTKIVTASQDGTAIVWVDPTGQWTDETRVKQRPSFREHTGPIYAAAFAHDGDTVASAGHDQRVLIWRDSELVEFDFSDAIESLGSASSQPAANIVSLVGHTAAVRSVSFSRDGNLLVSGGHDNSVRLWSVASGETLKRLAGHGEWVRACQLSGDQQSILSASFDRTVRLWDIEGYEERRILRGKVLNGHEDSVLAAEFSRDGRRVVTASRDRTIMTWDIAAKKQISTYHEGHAFLASKAAYFADGSRLATAAVDGSVRIWDVDSGAQLKVLRGTGRKAILATAPGGKFVVSGSKPTTNKGEEPTWSAKIWNGETGKPVKSIGTHDSAISAVAISSDEKVVCTGDDRGLCKLWDVATGKQVGEDLDWHRAKVLEIRFISKSQSIVTAAREGAVAVWNVGTGERTGELKNDDDVISMDADADGQFVVTACNDQKLRVWDVKSERLVRTITLPEGVKQFESASVALSPNKQLIVAADRSNRNVHVFDVASGNEVEYTQTPRKRGSFLEFGDRTQVWSAVFSPNNRYVLTLGGDQVKQWSLDRSQVAFRRLRLSFSPQGVVAAADYSTDGTKIVSASLDGIATVWDVTSKQSILKLTGFHGGAVNSAVFSPDPESKYVLTGSNDGTAVLWNSVTGSFIRRFTAHKDGVLKAVFSDDGRRVITASADRTLLLWDVADSAKPLLPPMQHDDEVRAVAFSHDGTRAVSGSADNTAKVWDLRSGKCLAALASHTAPVNSVAFNHNDTRLLTGSADFHAKLWDARSDDAQLGKELMTLKGHDREITSVSFSQAGHHALTASHDGTAIIWTTTKITR